MTITIRETEDGRIVPEGPSAAVCVVPYLYVLPTARRDKDGSWTVEFTWTDTRAPLDRPYVGGISTGRNKDLARRLILATLAGVIFRTGAERVEDIYGQSYVQATWGVLGRTLNSDLRRLGF